MEHQATVPEGDEDNAYYAVRPLCRCESCAPSVESEAIHVIFNALVSDAICAYAEHGSLHSVPKHLIRYLPLGFISTYAARDVDHAWHLLPPHAKLSSNIAACRRCLRHFKHRGEGRTDFDGSNPMIKDCKMCQLEFTDLWK